MKRSRGRFVSLDLRTTSEPDLTQLPSVIIKEEHYGEADQPYPLSVYTEIKEKFVDWDLYKLTVIKNNIDLKKKQRYMRIQ